MMQLENDLKNIENDLSVFIKSKKANLVKDRLELQKKSPVLDIAVNSQVGHFLFIQPCILQKLFLLSLCFCCYIRNLIKDLQ